MLLIFSIQNKIFRKNEMMANPVQKLKAIDLHTKLSQRLLNNYLSNLLMLQNAKTLTQSWGSF